MDNLDKKASKLYGKKKISSRKRKGVKKTQTFGAKRDWGSAPSMYKQKNKRPIAQTIFFASLGFFVIALL